MAIKNNSIFEYLNKIKGIELGLRETGIVVPEELIMSITLLRLGNKFKTLVTVITHCNLPTLDKLYTILLDKEVKVRGVEGLPREGAYLARSGLVCWYY